jgi:hypothetical protein
VITVVGVGEEVLLSTTTRVFDAKLRLKRGLQKLTVWPSDYAHVDPATPGDVTCASRDADEYFRLLKLKEM